MSSGTCWCGQCPASIAEASARTLVVAGFSEVLHKCLKALDSDKVGVKLYVGRAGLC